jgi:hypothetical protein
MSAVHKEKASSSSLLPVERRLWTPEDLAAYLGVEPGWVYRRTGPKSKKRIPHLKMDGKLIRFDPESPLFKQWLTTLSVN